MGKPKSKSGCKGDIKFANSKKSKKFECATLEGQDVEAVGGLSVVLGGRLKKAGVCTAEDLSCKMTGMTKRNYLRYIIKESGSNVRYAMDSYVSLKKHCEKMHDCPAKHR